MHLFLRVWVYLQCGVAVFVILCAVHCLRLHYWWWHIVPGFEKNMRSEPWLIQMRSMETVLSRVWFYYDEIRNREWREEIVNKAFGRAIGQLVLSFVGRFRLTEQDWIQDDE